MPKSNSAKPAPKEAKKQAPPLSYETGRKISIQNGDTKSKKELEEAKAKKQKEDSSIRKVKSEEVKIQEDEYNKFLEKLQFEEFGGVVEDVKEDLDLPPSPEYKVDQLIQDRPYPYIMPNVNPPAKVPKAE